MLSLWRNVILARALGPQEVGAATLFALILAFLEMVTDLGADRLLARDSQLPSPRLAAAHAVALVRGALLASILICGSAFVPALGGVSTHPACYWLALTVGLRGLQHLGPRAASGRLRFGPALRVELLSQLGALIVAWPIAQCMPDYRAILAVGAAQSLVQGIASHAIAHEDYWLGWRRADLVEILRFGAPLLLDGVFVFAINQGDRAVIGVCLPPAEVGRLTATLSLALVPTLVLARVAVSLSIPYLARAAAAGQLRSSQRRATLLALGAGGCLGVGFATCGGIAVEAIYGVDFRASGSLFVLLGIGQVLRVVREAWIGAALALGDSAVPPRANSLRLAGVALAFFVGTRHPDPVAIVASGLAGEALATSCAAWFLMRRTESAVRPSGEFGVAIRSGVG